MAINIINASSTHNTTAKAGRSLQYIVFHYTAGTQSKAGTAKAVASMFSTMSGQASADFIVDDGQIVQYNPDLKNRYCWHCGDGSSGTYGGQCYNSNSIGIEVCSSNKAGKVTDANDSYWYFTDAVLEQARQLINYLMKTYNIPLSHVIRHYDVSKKYCPGVPGFIPPGAGEAKWLAFKKTLSASDASTATTSTTAKTTTTENHSPCVASGMQKFTNKTGDRLYVYSSSRMLNTEQIGFLKANETCYCFGKLYSSTCKKWVWAVAYGLDSYPGDYKIGYVDDGGNTNFK